MNNIISLLWLLPPFLCFVFAARPLAKKRFQFSLPELLLFPVAFFPTIMVTAGTIVHTPVNGSFELGSLVVFFAYQAAPALLMWARSRDALDARWRPAVMMAVGAWLGLIVGALLLAAIFVAAFLASPKRINIIPYF